MDATHEESLPLDSTRDTIGLLGDTKQGEIDQICDTISEMEAPMNLYEIKIKYKWFPYITLFLMALNETQARAKAQAYFKTNYNETLAPKNDTRYRARIVSVTESPNGIFELEAE